jgi:hypothetical protein
VGTLFPDDDEYPGQRPLPARLAPGPVRSLILAFVIVTVATIALVFFEDRTAQRQWPALAAPVIPAIYILGLFFTGGFMAWRRSRDICWCLESGISRW